MNKARRWLSRLRQSRWVLVGLVVAILPLLLIAAGSVYYSAAGGAACAKCHELAPVHAQWMNSSHRNVQCKECHGSIFTTDVGFHLNNARQVWKHGRGEVPERLLVRQQDISRGLNERCARCHAQEFAAWQSGPHAASYEAIFLKEAHNHARLPTDHCLQCHGMYFETGIRDLIAPLDSKGPWRWVADPALKQRPSIPCLACHEIHRTGKPMDSRVTPATETNIASSASEDAQSKTHRPSLAFYDRREQMHFGVDILPLPAIQEGSRAVAVSSDRRQTLCYQCHAPDHTMQAGSGDDRTGVGVHEGISCLACHQTHQQGATASCATCHPRLSNCGLDVEQMDTTFKTGQSRHNIHSVKCVDCHPGGVPEKKRTVPAAQTPVLPLVPSGCGLTCTDFDCSQTCLATQLNFPNWFNRANGNPH